MKKKFLFILLSIFFLIFFITFTYLARAQIFNQFDFNTTVRLQNHIPTSLDIIFSVLSLIGSVEIISGILLIVLILKKKLISFLAFIPFFAAHFIEIIGKTIFYHPGPPFMFFRYSFSFLFPSSYVQPGSSYPSGHSLRIIFISVVFFYLIIKSKINIKTKIFVNIFLVLFNVAMLISRVSLGEHWTTDVIGGSLLGLSSGIFSLIFL
jgi:membrane-associated phospholipid phosphatase